MLATFTWLCESVSFSIGCQSRKLTRQQGIQMLQPIKLVQGMTVLQSLTASAFMVARSFHQEDKGHTSDSGSSGLLSCPFGP